MRSCGDSRLQFEEEFTNFGDESVNSDLPLELAKEINGAHSQLIWSWCFSVSITNVLSFDYFARKRLTCIVMIGQCLIGLCNDDKYV